MDIFALFPLALFIGTMCITPGPNNIMLTASGANFGFTRTLPHIAGIQLGVVLLYCATAIGLGTLFELFPSLHYMLKLAGSLYLLIFACMIATAQKKDDLSNKSEGAHDKKLKKRPLKLIEATLFQFLNPKAFLITLTTISTFSNGKESFVRSVVTIIGVFICIGPLTALTWASFGTMIGRLLTNTKAFRLFNLSLGILTATSILILWI